MTDCEMNLELAYACAFLPQEAPDFCSDLNAVFEAERRCLGHDPENFYKYATQIDRNHSPEWLVHVAARQRVIALLKVIGRYKSYARP